MKRILVAGAGKSSTVLIRYLIGRAEGNDWEIIVADASREAILQKTGGAPRSTTLPLDIMDDAARRKAVDEADIVVSLMPPQLHALLAKDCLDSRKHLITSSYISAEMAGMDEAAKEAGLMFMCEMGLDPGIDHMTAAQILDDIKEKDGQLVSFKSYCGGLVAPESDDNPWHYKFTWNPRNIITAGADGAQYLEGGKEVRVEYANMFAEREAVQVDGLGELAYYPNRDSLHYIDLYGVHGVKDFLRATLRYPDFCAGWNALLKLGLTNVSEKVDPTGLTYKQWVGKAIGTEGDVEAAVAQKLGVDIDDKLMDMLRWIGIFKEAMVPLEHTTNGDILLFLLQKVWAIHLTDKDMVVMQHEVGYEVGGKNHGLHSTLIVIGDDSEATAMAKTVGLPMGILAELVLNGEVEPIPGVHIPTDRRIYEPVLKGLEREGIVFTDKEV